MKRIGELTDLSEAPPPKRVKADPAELLNVIFRFKHKSPSNRQDEPLCKTLVKEFQVFVETLNPVAIPSHCCGHVNPLVDDSLVPVSVFAAHEVGQLHEVYRRLEVSDDEPHNRGDVWIEPWLPMYGCALQRTKTSAALVKLEVVFVDGWERTLHFLPTGECVHSAVPTKHHVLHCADLDAALEGKFGSEFAWKLQKAQEGKGSKRSAAANSLGHQKTPQFIAAVVRRAVASVTRTTEEEKLDEGNVLFSPYGGTTDVGMHTGGKPRDTCWPLVQAVIQHNLCCGRKLFQKAMLLFQLSLLQQSVHVAESTFQHEVNIRTGCDMVDDMFFMLQVVVQHLVEFLERGYDVSAMHEQCTALRASLDGFVDVLNHQTAVRYRLPDAVSLQPLNTLACDVQVASPQRDLDSNAEESDEVRRLRALAALEGCWLVDGVVCSHNALLEWGKSTAAPKAYKCILLLRTIETFMFARSLKLKGEDEFEHADDDDELYVERMKSLVTTYQKVIGDWRQLSRASSVMDVEQRSRKLLVIWIAFCLVHQRCVELVPLCAEYNIALKWRDLKVAVLSDRAAMTALQNTAQYIRAWNERTKGSPLFHLTEQDATFDFARRFGLSSGAMIGVYNREVESWEMHVQTQWRAIETKKARAKELRAEMSSLDEEMSGKKRQLSDEKARLNAVYPPSQYAQSFRESGAKAQFMADINRINREKQRLKASLDTALAAPAALVRPLPVLKDDAIQVIFMLTMPRDVEVLGSLCLTAQRALAPEEATTEMQVRHGTSSTAWQSFCTNAAPTQGFRATTTEFTVMTGSTYLPGCYVPKTIDSLSSIGEFKNNCVANPILRGTSLTWQDSTGNVVNPFKANSKSVIESFMEKMPASFEQFQWMNTWPGEDATRGNVVYANLSEQPESFDKASFVALGSLRAYPNQQFRKLQCALLDDAFPWAHTGVETLVRQSLYQVGDLTDEEEPKFLWKTDVFDTESGIATFGWTLQRLAEKLEQTPRCFENVPLLSELAGYVSQFTDVAKPIVKRFARMARRWAEDSRSDEGEITAVRRKRCILYGYALLAYKLGPLDDEAAQEVCELIVLFRTSFVCARIKDPPSEQMLIVEGQVAEMMTRRIVEILAYVERRGADTVLSALVRLVSATSSTNLYWQHFSELSLAGEQFSSCFQSAGSRCAINLFSGVVLTDGYAPGGLPVKIREHGRFENLFGACNVEVLATNGVFQAKETYCDRLYEFAIQAADDELFVQELTVDASRSITSTLQVCSLHWIKSFGELFPARLRDLYSHWYWVERDCVLFRPRKATSRMVFFVATLDSGALQCYQVPMCDWNRPYDEILDRLAEYDMFARKENVLLEVLRVLSKLEDEEFLHPLKTSDNILKIELPRFKLTFLLNEKMQLESVEHKGYVLATQQQFDDCLPRFHRYLLLELRDQSDTSRPELRMLLPVGRVVENIAGWVDVDVPSKADSVVAVACYDLHRRLETFETETIAARLQLAAVYVRAGTNVPSKRLRMTGAEAALPLLRACRSSSPYSLSERETLQAICDLSFRVPAVKVLAVALLTKANQFGFLSGDNTADNWAMESADEKSEYGDLCSGRRHTVRTKLRNGEERSIFGQRKSLPLSRPSRELLALNPIPVAENCVKTFEAKLRALILYTSASAQLPPLPLQSRSTDAMGQAMLSELHISWNCHHAQPRAQLKYTSDALSTAFRTCLGQVSVCRCKMEKYLNDAVAKWTRDPRDHLLSHVNGVPTVTVRDLVTCSFDDEILYALTLHLTVQARDRFKTAVLQYMELCVLEDKVERLVAKLKHRDEMSDSQVIDELETTRQWKSTDYPFWLAFEVEGRLQIRHEQYVVAKHLIDAPGTVCQLNMGRGKTRVILPMLFLHFTRRSCPRVVRAHFLGCLLSEAGHAMHRFLSASSAQLHIFEQPFDRKIDLDARKLELLKDALHEMKLFGGIQIVSPAHRMSLELKRLELRDDEALTGTLDEILDNDQFVDVLDECDALLHHKYHLVYAVGTPRPLQSGSERWEVAEALLRVVAEKSSRAANLLPHLSCSCPDYAERRGAFQGTRLQAAVESTEHLRAELKTALVLDLVENPPFELLWLKTLGRGDARDLLVDAITNPSIGLNEALGGHRQKFEPYVSQLLVLRGLVAFGVLEHCMEKRYRVDFGLPLAGPGKKKTAIPFQAADVPAERSEFSHPDVCIVLTLLGYYHGGLTDKEVRSTFENLLGLDVSEQRERYEQWYASVKSDLSDEEERALCDVRQLSLTDERQFDTLSRVYQFCMETINFYLNTCVLPKDTQQFPQRLSRTAWNLARGDNNIGFSGTNDHHRLLPLSVTQREPDEPSLLGTNGKMIATILQVTQSYEVVRPSPGGVTNHDAAEFLLGHVSFRFAGVTYYDSRKELNCWMIMEKAHRMETPQKKASMLERETFVIFDEARSRGSDMKLPYDASACLTLGPKLTKDKLMQGAGRMRQLGCHQKLWLASFDEVAQSILQASDKKSQVSSLTTIDVLNWVLDNTKAESVRGLLEWASNGIHFRKTQLDRGAELVDEDWSLQTLYEEKITADKTARIIEAKASRDFGRLDDTLIADICRRSTTYGLDNEVCYTAHTDECERELHVEEEQEQEKEVQVAKHQPMKEKAWKYAHILGVPSIERLSSVVNVVSMASHIRQWVSPKRLASLAWSPACVFGTENFFGTIVARRNMDRTNEFLRVVDAMLVFDNGQVLLLSECEADHILELLWSIQGRTTCSFRFVNFTFACESIDHVGTGTAFGDVRLALGPGMEQEVPLLSVAACHLYNGETMLAKHQQSIVEPVFRDLLYPLAQREATLSNFVKSRGNGRKWTRSFLHKLCRRMDLKTASTEAS